MPNPNPAQAAKDIDEDIERRLDQLVAMVPEVRRADYAEGWNACLDAVQQIAVNDDNPHRRIALAERLELLRK